MMQDDLLWRHLKTVPAFRALLRAVEARFYRQMAVEAGEPWPPTPCLDLGCGDGHFAQMTFDRPLAVGVDPWWGPLRQARRTGAFQSNIQAKGDNLPFPDSTFASIVSNSVLEHIPDVAAVLGEVNRVLRPGGWLIFTTPSHYFTKFLGGAALLERWGLQPLAEGYRRFFNFISRHHHTDRPEQWAERLAAAGLAVERWQYYFSPGALRALEMGHIQGLPSAALHFLTGHWIVAPWESNLRATERWVRPYYEEEPPAQGAYLFFVARKEERPAAAAELPEARPLERRDWRLEIGDWVDGDGAGVPAGEPTPVLSHVAGETLVSAPTAVADQPPAVGHVFNMTPPNRKSPISNLQSPLLTLLVVALAAVAQAVFRSNPAEPRRGVTWYVLALGMLLALSLPWREIRARLAKVGADRRRLTADRRLWFYPLGLFLAYIAHLQAGTRLDSGRPGLAFLFWLLGVCAALYSLAKIRDWRLEVGDWRLRIGRRHVENVTYGIVAVVLVALLLRLVALSSHPFILSGTEANIGLEAWGVASGRIRNPFATAWLSSPTFPLVLLAGPLTILGRSVLSIRLLSPLVGAATVAATVFIGRRVWGREVGLAAAIFLAGSHVHIHYSRLGMTNVWDPLLVLLALGLLAVAWEKESRGAWLAAGAAIGFSALFYTAGHLLPLMLVAVLGFMALVHGRNLWRQRGHVLAAIALALVIALPQLLYYRANWGAFMERANSLGIFQSGWLAQEAARTGLTTSTLLSQQLWKGLLGFTATLDTSPAYAPGIPLLTFWTAVLFLLGLGLALWRLRQLRFAILLIWVGVTAVFAGGLLENPPASHRLLVAAPALCLLAAVGLAWVGRRLAATFKLPGRYVLPVVAGAAVLLALGDVAFYFGPYRLEHRFGDRNTEVAHEMAGYLNALEGEWTAYFYGPPVMYAGFPTIPFLARDFEPGVNLLDVNEPGSVPAVPPAGNVVFVFLPERFGEAEAVQAAYPGGVARTFDGRHANPLFHAYEVKR